MCNFIDQFNYPLEFRLIGGEPTLHKDLDKIIAYAKKNNHRISIATNGLRISNKEYLKKLKESGLDTVYLSMTGFNDDNIYQITDRLNCARKKMKSLENVIDLGLRLSVGCIIHKNLNEHLIKEMFDYLKNKNCKVGTSLEFRNIGQIGRFLSHESYSFQDLKSLVKKELKVDKERKILEDNEYSYAFMHKGFRINITNWYGVDKGFNEQTNSLRGRMTEDFKVEPFLEHIKQNEGEY
jgi:molybdenum cofactor biosynthesis enzyme MoaA